MVLLSELILEQRLHVLEFSKMVELKLFLIIKVIEAHHHMLHSHLKVND
jgi:hypothetical protein